MTARPSTSVRPWPLAWGALVWMLVPLVGCPLVDEDGCPNPAHPSVRYYSQSLADCGVSSYPPCDDGDGELGFPVAGGPFLECGCGCYTAGYAEALAADGIPPE